MDLGRPQNRLARRLEAGIREDAQHGSVIEHHFCDELLDSHAGGCGSELLEQTGRDPAPLQLVRNRKGDLGGASITQPNVVRDGDDALALDADQRTALAPVRVHDRRDHVRVDGGVAVEAFVEALVRQFAEEREQRGEVTVPRRLQAHRRAVA